MAGGAAEVAQPVRGWRRTARSRRPGRARRAGRAAVPTNAMRSRWYRGRRARTRGRRTGTLRTSSRRAARPAGAVPGAPRARSRASTCRRPIAVIQTIRRSRRRYSAGRASSELGSTGTRSGREHSSTIQPSRPIAIAWSAVGSPDQPRPGPGHGVGRSGLAGMARQRADRGLKLVLHDLLACSAGRDATRTPRRARGTEGRRTAWSFVASMSVRHARASLAVRRPSVPRARRAVWSRPRSCRTQEVMQDQLEAAVRPAGEPCRPDPTDRPVTWSGRGWSGDPRRSTRSRSACSAGS